MLEAILGEDKKGREELLYLGVNRGEALRQGKWTYLAPNLGMHVNENTKIELGNSLDPQLYNMDFDIGQRKNVAQIYPEIVKKMQEKIDEIKGE